MRIGIMIIVLCLAGCVAPSLTKPVGTPLEPEALEKLTGVWQSPDDGSNFFQVKSVGQRLFLGGLQFDAEQRTFTAHTLEAVITAKGDQKYLFLGGQGDTKEYFFFEITNLTDDALTTRSPDPDVFRQAVKEGKLSGKIITTTFRQREYQRAQIDADEEEFFAFVNAKGRDVCFPPGPGQTYRKLNAAAAKHE